MEMNTITIDGDRAQIIIESESHGTQTFIIDARDVELVQAHNWHVARYRNYFYAMTNTYREDGTRTVLTLHRFLLLDTGVDPIRNHVDHIDGDTRNNSRSNLRWVTPQENQWNRVRARGYTWRNDKKKWMAQLVVNGQRLHLGYHSTEESAREAYLAAKRVHHAIGRPVITVDQLPVPV